MKKEVSDRKESAAPEKQMPQMINAPCMLFLHQLI